MVFLLLWKQPIVQKLLNTWTLHDMNRDLSRFHRYIFIHTDNRFSLLVPEHIGMQELTNFQHVSANKPNSWSSLDMLQWNFAFETKTVFHFITCSFTDWHSNNCCSWTHHNDTVWTTKKQIHPVCVHHVDDSSCQFTHMRAHTHTLAA